MKTLAALLLGATALVGTSALAQTTLTIATVNNNDMIVMQKLSKSFEEKNPDIKLNWVTLEENVLRQKITTDIATQGGQYDIMTIGMFEAPLFGERGWLAEFADVPAAYQLDDVLKSVRDGLSFDGKLYALPFYAESQITFYRKDLFDKAGITMPDQPTWEQIGQFAEKITDKANEIYGVCLRGKPGWGENMGQISPVVNSYGGRWFDMDWKPQLMTEPWKEGVTTYVDLIKKYGPPGASSNGFNETLALFASGKCGMWVDATVAAGFLTDKKQSQVTDKMGYAHPPIGKFNKGNHYLWSWALAVPASSKEPEAAKKFIYWATSKDYIKLVAEENGWAAVPPGTRTSTYATPEYISAAPFAKLTLETIQTANPTDATQEKVPYRGISYVGIPEFPSFGTAVGQKMSAVIAGQTTVEDALSESQKLVERTMKQAGYPKK
jgi:sorbitol/mannitol transport system substrate-binding protein